MNLDKYRNIIIDTSAFMAFFYQEEGWELVAKYMPKSILSAVNLSEAIKIFKEYEDISKEQSLEYIYKAVEKVIPFDEQQAGIAGEMVSITKPYGLSLGDRACIAAGIVTGLPIVTADRIWKEIDYQGVEIIVVR
ncbi:PilT protein domain protein [Candidatus Jidaibacter acanthamoeba]|uniref:PilT protein domain protein n=1 Tax=Candidatus Jidaibacter acanthamoebae TaxID=86105 RepID=A0A0C1MWU3_9RICK|nr:type II toxin-antitoxin system VapC family toxin [Candidatus Jidaibacter acanthamoeba]KIE04371.1 PilT protein domain protein [Candidatus Jidaibacter acanthamoeba]